MNYSTFVLTMMGYLPIYTTSTELSFKQYNGHNAPKLNCKAFKYWIELSVFFNVSPKNSFLEPNHHPKKRVE